jgi:Response regulator containing a CheY-like receiver domain and an HTH DNA-binding domain
MRLCTTIIEMNVMKQIQNLYEEFICNRSILYDVNYVIDDSRIETLRDIAKMQNSTLALCNVDRDEYNFLHRSGDKLHPVLQGVIPVATLFELVHPEDYDHFVEAWRKTFLFLKGVPIEKFKDYALVFECRLRNQHGRYCRVMFKYKMVEHQGNVIHGHVLMMLKAVCDINIDDPSREIYIFNTHTGHFNRKFNPESPTERQIEIASLCVQGCRAEDIARKLFISPKTVYNHFDNLMKKTHTGNFSHAAMYLREMGVV